MKKLIWTLMILVVVGVFGGRAWWLYQHRETNTNVVKIGVLTDLSGFSSGTGHDTLVGIQEAVKKINADPTYEFKMILSAQDHKFLAKETVNAFRKVQAEGIDALILMGSVPVFAVAPLIDQAKLPTIVTSASDSDVPNLSPWMFRGWIYVKPQAELLANFIKNDLNIDEVALFKIKNQFGDDYEQKFTKSYEKESGRVIATESFGISDSDVKAQVAKLISKKPKAIVVFGFEHGAATAVDTLQEQGFSGPILTTPDSVLGYKEWKGKGKGVYFTSPNWDFLDPDNKLNIHAMFGYVDTLLLAEAIKNAGKTPDGIRKGLLGIKNFDSVFGTLKYEENGELIFPKFIIKQMQPDGTAKVIRE